MSRDYFRSKEGEMAWKEIGMEYNNGNEEMYDKWYADFQRLTKNTKKEDHKIYISQMKRFVRKDGSEFLIHDMREEKQDPIGNRKTFYRGGIGKYGKPHAKKVVKVDPETYEKAVVIDGVDYVEDSYSIPFDKKHIEPLLKYTDGNTAYSIQKEDYQTGITISIRDYQSWVDGKPIELLRFGQIATDYQREILKDEAQGKYTHLSIPPSGNTGQYR
jgi:hypothetical protein